MYFCPILGATLVGLVRPLMTILLFFGGSFCDKQMRFQNFILIALYSERDGRMPAGEYAQPE